jgi:hypothetical protein
MALALWGWLALASGQASWLVTVGGVILGSGVYGLGVWALGVREARGVVKAIARRFLILP